MPSRQSWCARLQQVGSGIWRPATGNWNWQFVRFIVRGVGAGSSGFQEITLDFSALRWGINSQREASMDRGALLLGFILTLLAAAGGCQANRPKVASAEAPAVPVSHARPTGGDRLTWTSPAGPRRSIRWTSARESLATWSRCRSRKGRKSRQGDLLFVVDPRPLQGPGRPGSGPGRSLSGLAQAGQDDPCPRPGDQLPVARLRSASSNSIRNRPTVDEAEARVKAYEKSHGILQAQPRIHPGYIADRRPDQPLLPDSRQPGQPGSDAA